MPCYRPMKGWRSRSLNENGKREITFTRARAFIDMPVTVPCGQCIGCRLEKSRQWAMRMVHEASLYTDNCFITLTYDEDHLPEDRSLNKKHFQDFMKRLRKKYPREKENNIRYYHCGEYGDQLNRPHYHAALFNFDFEDKRRYKTRKGVPLFRSDDLEKLWPFGYSAIGALTFESAAYIARYVTKKVGGDKKEDHYRIADPETGEYWDLEPEYATMSRRPGIGKKWFDKYHTDAYPSDFVTIRGKKMKPPRYYDQLLAESNESQLLYIKALRKRKGEENADDNTLARLRVKEEIKHAQFKQLMRGIE